MTLKVAPANATTMEFNAVSATTEALQLDLEPKTPVPIGNRIRFHCVADISKLNEVWALQFILSGRPEDSFHAMKPLNGLPLIYLPSSGYPERIEELPSEKGNLLFEHGNATELRLSIPVRKSSNGSLASCQPLEFRNNKHTSIEKREIVVTWEPSVELHRHVNDSFSIQTRNIEVTENQMLIVLCKTNLGSPPSQLSAIKLKLNGTDVPRSTTEILAGSDHDSREKTALCEYRVIAKRAMNGFQLFCVVNETHQSTTAYLTVKAIAPPQEMRLLVIVDFVWCHMNRKYVNFSIPEPVTVSHVLNKLEPVCNHPIERDVGRYYRFPVDGTNKTVYEVQKSKSSGETIYASEEGQLFASTALSPPQYKRLQMKDKFVNVKGYWNIIEAWW